MARSRTKKQPEKPADKVKWQGFVNVYLSPTEKKAIKDDILSEDVVISHIEALCKDGYKVSFSYSPEGNFFTASAYGNTPDNPNAGWVMSLRHKDILTALTCLVFSNEYKAIQGDWEGKSESTSDIDW